MTMLYCLACLLPSNLEDDLSLLRGSLPHIDWAPRTPLLLPLLQFYSSSNNPLLEDLHYDLSMMKWKNFALSLQNIFLNSKKLPPQHLSQNLFEIQLAVANNQELENLQQKITHLLYKNNIKPSIKNFIPHYLLGRIAHLYHEEAIKWVQRHNLFKSQELSINELVLIEYPPLTKHNLLPPLSTPPHIIETYQAENSLANDKHYHYGFFLEDEDDI